MADFDVSREFGHKVKERREALGISLSQLARRAGCSKAYLSMLESGANPATGKPISPTIRIAEAIAKALRAELSDLV